MPDPNHVRGAESPQIFLRARLRASLLFAGIFMSTLTMPPAAGQPLLTLDWEKNILTIRGEHLPNGKIEIHYLEAYCRPNSTDRDWHETIIGHRTELLARAEDGTSLQLRCTLTDGVTMHHTITSSDHAVDFQLVAHNPTAQPSLAHWAQPCVRVGHFTGHHEGEDRYAYLERCFVFLEDEQAVTLPTPNWATEARYVPGQVWCPVHVPREDVNPRPLSPDVPSNGLIGCYSADQSLILATAWEPYQELFQGVIRCIHSDFRIGGLPPGATKKIRGKIYVVKNDLPALLERYHTDFPEHRKADLPVPSTK